MSSIFFTTRPDSDGVDCLIYSEEGRLLATHHMTLEGARVRCHDFEAAIDGATWNRELSEVLAFVSKPV